jgi:glyoxylase-like metal-dependent hydrolase (beta-lactamase superfamily II)
MKKIAFTIFTLIIAIQLFGQDIKISDNLTLHKLSEQTYIHAQGNNNGLVYINKGEAIIVSTPESDIETQNLIDWVINDKKAKLVGYIIDRWHTDAMEGLDIVKQNEIKSYSYELTRSIAKEKGLPVPEIGFDPKLELSVGGNKVICHFLGEAHTKDGIVVWIPSEQILFGGNGIRNYNGWVGNIGDANIEEWSKTAERIKKEYGTAKIVIPGHGSCGGAELIDYTIELYKTDNKSWILNNQENSVRPDFKNNEDFLIIAESDSVRGGNRILRNAIVFVQDSTKYAKIESELIEYQPENRRIDSDSGYLKIFDKTSKGDKLRIGVSYNRLIIFKQDDSIGLRIILREMHE